MPLTLAARGETSSIKRITGKDEVKRHLANLGFVEGKEIVLISQVGGNVIVGVNDARIALDRSLAQRIMI